MVSKKKVAKEFTAKKRRVVEAPTPTVNAPMVSKRKAAKDFS